MAGTALSIHGVIALADAMRIAGTSLTAISGLKDRVEVGDGSVDYFAYDNPLWTDIGTLVPSKDRDGNSRKTLRMSFQTRKAMGTALIDKLGL